MATSRGKLKETAKRTFEQIRKKILKYLSDGQKTINALSNETGINWKTVDNHLTYLIGRGLVNEVFSSEYVRVFELTEEGKEFVVGEFPNSHIEDHKIIHVKKAKL